MKRAYLLWMWLPLFFACQESSHPQETVSKAYADSLVTELERLNTSLTEPYLANFPEDWVGEYEGELEIFIRDTSTVIQRIPVELILKSDSVSNQWVWKTVYRDTIRGIAEKNYTLKKMPDAAPQEFLFDENNGIAFPQYYLGNIFYSHYSLYDQMFTVSYKKLTPDLLLFELVVIPNTVIDSVDAGGFIVNSHALTQIQRCYFKRK